MFCSILVPLDRSSFAEQALPLALSIARRAGASLDLLQVHLLYAFEDPKCPRLPYDPALDREQKQQEQLYLDGTATWVTSVSAVPVTTAVVEGLVADGILSQAQARKADLIVMTTHGRGPASRFFLGSVADELIRRTPIPVLLVRPTDITPSLIPEPVVEHIVIPLDGSALAEQVLEPAFELAHLLEARCSLLRMVEEAPPVPGGASSGHLHVTRAEAEAYLERIASQANVQGVPTRAHVSVGRHAAETILEEARAFPSHLIALATHGRGGVRRMLLGSVADKVIRGASSPVLVYRPQQDTQR